MVQILGASVKLYGAAGKCKLNEDSPGGSYPNETCLIPGTDKAAGKFPVTEGGRLSPGRIRNVAVRASQHGYTEQVKKGGFCSYANKIKLKSTICGKGNGD